MRKKQTGAVAELGANQVVAIDDEAAIGKLPQLDAIADTVGGEVIARLLPRLRKGGVVGSVLGEPAAAKGREVAVRAISTHSDPKRLRELAEAFARGELRIPIGNRFPIDQAREAIRVASRGGAGKVLITF